jgi:hypothetical protein
MQPVLFDEMASNRIYSGSGTMVLSYVIIAAIADAYPATSRYNRGASIAQVVFIYVIQMAYGTATHFIPPASFLLPLKQVHNSY